MGIRFQRKLSSLALCRPGERRITEVRVLPQWSRGNACPAGLLPIL
jgi:hypothetical protein